MLVAASVQAVSPSALGFAGPLWLLLGAPPAEELVFRAGLQSWLAPRIGAAAAVGLGSALFAATHVALTPTLLAALTFFPSLVLGAVYAATGRLRHAVALHALFNALWMHVGATALRAVTT